jgi:hypothetical protein
MVKMAKAESRTESNPGQGQPSKDHPASKREVAPGKGALKERPTPKGISPILTKQTVHKQGLNGPKSWATMVEEEEILKSLFGCPERQEDRSIPRTALKESSWESYLPSYGQSGKQVATNN